MITREQLINKVISAVPLDDISIAKDAVDEYEEQVCCGFAEWVLSSGWHLNPNCEETRWRHFDRINENRIIVSDGITTKELYQLYKNKDT